MYHSFAKLAKSLWPKMDMLKRDRQQKKFQRATDSEKIIQAAEALCRPYAFTLDDGRQISAALNANVFILRTKNNNALRVPSTSVISLIYRSPDYVKRLAQMARMVEVVPTHPVQTFTPDF